MTRRFLFKTSALALLLALSLPMSSQLPRALEVSEHTLSNGMTVWLNEDHSQPKIYGAVVVHAGAKDCPDTGIAHYFEHIMFKGTEEIGTTDYTHEKPWLDSIAACYDRLAATKDEAARNAIQKDINRLSQKAGEYAIPNEFNNLISRYGGSLLNAGTSYDFTFYHNMFTPRYLEHWCILNSDRFINPVFRMFQGELETVYEEKNMNSDDMTSFIRDKCFKELFGTNAYAYPIIGSTENLKNPRLSEMKAFYEKYYVASNMGLVLTGDFSSDSIMPLLERTFGRIPRGVKPTRVTSPLPDIKEERTVSVPIPIPLVSLEALVFKSCTDFEKDANALTIATKLLTNGNAGRLDSLANEGKLMMSAILPTSLNDAGVILLLVVPNLLSKCEKAEEACLTEIRRIANGDFSDAAFVAQKQKAHREAMQDLETIDKRFMQMVMAMSSGHSWREYMDKVNAIDQVTREEVTAASKRYFETPFVRFKKKFGSLEKDKVSQPGYTPVIPKNKGVESEYAKRLAALPVADSSPRLLDFEHDATSLSLSGQAKLYTVKNSLNDLFQLTVSYNRGLRADPRLESAVSLANNIGTDSLTRQQFGSALDLLGGEMSMECTNNATTLTVTGLDKNFAETMKLVGHFLQHMKSNDKALKNVKDIVKAEEKSLTEDNSDVMKAMVQKVTTGDQSTSLHRQTYKEVKKLSGEDLLSAIDAIKESACDIVYSGTLDINEVESVVRKTLPVERSCKTYIDYSPTPISYDSPVVYVFDMPKARQTLFFTYDQLPTTPTLEDRVPAFLMEEYFGGGMSSVLFQEVREFRSMAYSTNSHLMTRPRLRHPNSPLGLISYVGTQGDKTMSAIALVDSLLHDMPLIENQYDIARQNCINEIYNQFPSFRSIGSTIANMQRNGYQADSRTGLVELYQGATMADLAKYYESHIKGNAAHRVLGIVGSKKKLNLKELEKYGKVVFLKEKDLFRK
ncbi:MAG: insulinase family protein [Prevotella sp.]|nr:insulinase family protein [Prevotella sp.]